MSQESPLIGTTFWKEKDIPAESSSATTAPSQPKLPTRSVATEERLRDLYARRFLEVLRAREERVSHTTLPSSPPLMDVDVNPSKETGSEYNQIAPERKKSIFSTEVTEEEQEIIKQRVAQQQKSFQEFEKRKITGGVSKIQNVHPHVCEEEAIALLKECNEDEEEVIVRLMEDGVLQSLRKKIAQKAQEANRTTQPRGIGDEEDRRAQRRARRAPSTAADARKKRFPKLRLDDALEAKVEKGTFEGWSPARIRAYQLINTNPNAYYYRFNAIGEKQRNGKWTEEEKQLFFKRMKEVGVNHQWGIFSMAIPGRVGYQCSNFYRQLIEAGEVVDDNYYIDEKGKAHYKFSKNRGHKKRSYYEADDMPADSSDSAGGRPAKRRKRNRRSAAGEGDAANGDSDDDDFRPSTSLRKATASAETDAAAKSKADNPLPGYIDPITLEEVEQPAISPYGHVMGWKSWLGCLSQEPRNICPLTKKPLHKRDLVLLTWENIHMYRSKIVSAD